MPIRSTNKNIPLHCQLAIVWAVVLLFNVLMLFTRWDATAIDADLTHILPQSHNNDVRYALSAINTHRNRQLLITVRADEPLSDSTLMALSGAFPSDEFTRHRAETQTSWFAEWYQKLLPYRQQLLSPSDRKALQHNNNKAVTQRALQRLYGFTNASPEQFAHDPLFLFQRYFEQVLPKHNDLTLQGDWLTSALDNQYIAILPLTLKQSAFDTDVQQHIKQVITRAKTIATNHHVHLSAVGAVVFAEHGFSQSKREMSTVGLGGLLGIILLLLYTFRSLRPLIVLLSALATSLAVALNLTLSVFGSVHMVALLFSASMIGVSIDYGFHFLSDFYQHRDSAIASIKRILSGLLLGLFSSVLAYSLFVLSGLLLLKQVALLAIIGLPSMLLTVTLILPYVYGKTSCHTPLPQRLIQSARILAHNPIARLFSSTKVLAAALLMALIGYFALTPNDDVRNLQAMPKTLLAEEQQLRSLFDRPAIRAYALLVDEKAHLVLEGEHYFPTSETIADLLPSLAEQKENHQLYQQLYHSEAAKHYHAQTLGAANLTLNNFQPLSIESFFIQLAKQPRFAERLLRLPNGKFALLIPIETIHNVAENVATCQAANLTHTCYIIRPTDDLSAQFGRYRVRLSLTLLMVTALLLTLALWRYRQRGWHIALLPTVAAITAVVTSAHLGASLSLFSILGALLVLGMGLDYVIFLAESQSPDEVMVSLTLSYLTTLLSFGLLAFSQTAAVSTFGLTTAIGMTLIIVLSPAVVDGKKHDKI